jgi:hypothetical protein
VVGVGVTDKKEAKENVPSRAVPTKTLVLRARNDDAVLARVRAQAAAAARPPDVVHPAVQHLIAAQYVPGALGWTVPLFEEEERDERGELTGRVAVVAEEVFCEGKPDFAAAGRLPDDWRGRSGVAQTPPKRDKS